MATTVFDKPIGTEIGQLSSLTTSNKTNLVNAINSLNSKIEKSNSEFFGTYPNGHMYNRDYFHITAPCWNPNLASVTVVSAYAYTSSGAFTDISQSVAVDSY